MPDLVTAYISPAEAQTLPGLFLARAARSAQACAYRYFDADSDTWRAATWQQAASDVARWRAALATEQLEPGARVAIMLRNRYEWMLFDQAALSLGLVVVPLYTDDRAENIVHVLRHSGAELLLIEGEAHWQILYGLRDQLAHLKRFLTLDAMPGAPHDARLRWAGDWLPQRAEPLPAPTADPDALASIVYTSGTTGRPKGVMLSHRNLLENAYAGLQTVEVYPSDLFLSFLPLSHTLERTGGYYLPMMAGACVAYARSVKDLAEDLRTLRPTVLISVPRIFERVYNRLQEQLASRSKLAAGLFKGAVGIGWRSFKHTQGRGPWSPLLWLDPALKRLVARKVMDRLGGRLRIAISGGAPLPPHVARLFIGLGLNLCQGYGLTEHSPVISVSRIEDNDPESVGAPVSGVEVRIGPQEELWARSSSVMLGYWQDPEATTAAIDADGWLHTGDKAELRDGRIYITGRIKDIIVLATGEKVSPADLEMTILQDPLFEQVMLVGEARAYLSALVVLNDAVWREVAHNRQLQGDAALPGSREGEAVLRARIGERLAGYARYAQVRRVAVCAEPWTIDNGLLTPTLKVRRERMLECYAPTIATLYEGHL